MSIQSMIGNAVSNVGHAATGALTELGTRLENAIGSASASISSLYDGGFVGLDSSNITTLTDSVEQYVQRLMAISDNFAKTNDISGALKGSSAQAAQEYVSAIAALLDAYCTTYRNFNTMANNAVSSFSEGDTSNASSIRDEAQNIITAAEGIKVD